ncbi:uncharacterized protein LY89DRAFT_687954 [Mollisia scopiformis]|uniref:Uncharacterized protein n=1 Tax=Mollisia scopiformis TaxID=149040 RepID=A0A194WYP6_MOLSC|nr:uncharacterized protein LY89DRAFT_687954 [Mollisia scopiformis]KUJ13086.1 hypothetical protein LY89DRAFT_687954 [Mollisia scopiformis]
MNPQDLNEKAHPISLNFIETRKDSITSSPSLLSQMRHRLRFISFWNIKPGSRVLEIGCGQGDTTVVLADAVGEDGHVDAIDPGSLDYGSPQTLGQAQQHIKSSPLGPRVTFHCPMDTITYLTSYTGPKYDYAVLSHCISYFPHPTTLPTLLTSLGPHTTKLCIAEWSLSPSLLSPAPSTPHILATLLFTYMETLLSSPSENNIRTALSPAQIKASVPSRFRLEREEMLETDREMQDGYWEVKDLLGRGKREWWGLDEIARDEKERAVLEGWFWALREATEAVGGVEEVRCMRVWVGVFGLGGDGEA